jgi:hypothetical protein
LCHCKRQLHLCAVVFWRRGAVAKVLAPNTHRPTFESVVGRRRRGRQTIGHPNCHTKVGDLDHLGFYLLPVLLAFRVPSAWRSERERALSPFVEMRIRIAGTYLKQTTQAAAAPPMQLPDFSWPSCVRGHRSCSPPSNPQSLETSFRTHIIQRKLR